MKLSLSEEAYSKAFYKAYNKYGNDIPDAEWQRLGELRARYGIEMSRVRKIINAVQEGTIVPDIEQKKTTTDKPKPASVVSILTDTARGMKYRANGTDCLLLDISDTIKSSIRRNFDLGLDEQILWVRDTSFWGSKNQGLVITDKQIVYIPDNDSPDSKYYIEFNDINKVEYREMSIFIWNYENEYFRLPVGAFVKDAEESQSLICDAQRLASALTQMAISAGHTETKTVFDLLNDYIEEGQYDEAEELAKQAISDFASDAEHQRLSYTYLARILHKKGENDTINKSSYMRDAIEAYDEALALCDDKDPDRFSLYKEKGLIEQEIDNTRVACNCFIAAMESTKFDLKKEAKEQYGQLMENLMQDERLFLDIDYNERKFIFTVNNDKHISGCQDSADHVKWVFPVNRIPSYINFPVGHPQPNTLYIGHPLKPGTFIPFENATEQLFMEKVRELCYLAQCLGAVEIKFKRIKGRDISNTYDSAKDISVNLGIKNLNIGLSGNKVLNKAETSSTKDGVELVQRYSPMEKPFCPNGLVWLDSDPTWQTLVKQRLTGNILSYIERVSSTETTNVTNSELLSIKGSVEYLSIKASGSYDKKEDKTFSKTEEMEWEIDMQFKPLQDFEDNAHPNISLQNEYLPEEEEYMEEVRFCLEDDNEINEHSRKFLERKRQKSGLSEARAIELETIVKDSLSASMIQNTDDFSEEELAYKSEVELCIEDGNEIDEHMRRFLDRKRQRLGLTEARAQEIESMVKASQTSFTKEEQEYMEILDEVIENGIIPNSVRRLLDREIKSLGLSEERAKELEEIKCKS